ncbi:hypothetical protein EAF04_007374 [Stromatinia cepivora]|nr:hypothetical protein EAF04_007374 [Stromatinia cepivora]
MSDYYDTSPLQDDTIRLLCLMPNKDLTAPIQCRLHNYCLKSDKATHLYQALSYVWGSSENLRPIFVNQKPLSVTANLHGALLQLRDGTFERIIWVDAICINQDDDKEKSQQIKLMAKIYGLADRVIVYLGEAADNSDQALKSIRVAEDEFMSSMISTENKKQILELLKRPWFQRIWVLQEVGLARHILIMCGSAEINGYTFSSGIGKLSLLNGDYSGLKSLIRPTLSLIRGAIFRPEYTFDLLNNLSLGELIDMSHSHKATKRHDKVYALLSMSSDGLNSADLLPDYKVSWKILLQRLVKFILYEKVNVETWDDREISIIRSHGCILGHISSVEIDDTRYHKQRINIIFNDTPISLWYESEYGTQWTLQASAQSIEPDDLVCLLHGASKPVIIRACKDHFTVIMIAVTLQQRTQVENAYLYQQPSASTHGFSYDFLLVWNWETIPENLGYQARYKDSTEVNSLVPEYLKTDILKAARLIDVAVALVGTKNYEKAQTAIVYVIDNYERMLGKGNLQLLSLKDSLAWTHKIQEHWHEAEIIFSSVIKIRQDLQGTYHPDTLSSKAKLVATYIDQEFYKQGQSEGGILTSLTDQIRDNNQIGEKELIHIARSFDSKTLNLLLELEGGNVVITEEVLKTAAGSDRGWEMMKLLFEKRGAEVVITEEVLKTAAGSDRGWEMMKLLFEERGAEVVITEEILKVVMGNQRNGWEIMNLLFKERRAEIVITEEVLKVVAGSNRGWEMMKLLFEKGGAEIVITEEVLKAAIRNYWNGVDIMKLLFEERGAEVVITEEVLKTAAGSDRGWEIMKLLFEKRGAEIVITKEVLKVVAGSDRGWEMMKLLFEKRGAEIVITEEVLKAAVGNHWNGMNIMILLFEERGAEIVITEEVLKAVVGNHWDGMNIMILLFEERGAEIIITEEVLKAVVGNHLNGMNIMILLFEERGAEIVITEEVLKAAIRNYWNGVDIMKLLFEERGAEVVITEEVLKTAAGSDRGWEMMKLLFEKRGAEIIITEEVLKAAAGDEGSGQEMMKLLLEHRAADQSSQR